MEELISSSSILSVVYLTIFTLVALHTYRMFRRKKYAPGPWGFPVVGHLPLFGPKPTTIFRKWQQRYGNVFRIRLGSWNTVVLNGYSTIKEALERHDEAFSDRPDFLSTRASRELRDNEESMEFGPFNVAYLRQRKLTAYALRKFTNTRNEYFQDLLHSEVETLTTGLLLHKEKPYDVRETITLSVGSIVYQILFGKGHDITADKDFVHLLRTQEDFLEVVGSGNATDVLPWLRFILPQKLKRFITHIKMTDSIIQKKVTEHKQNFDAGILKDVTDVFLSARLPKYAIDKSVDVTENRQMITLSDMLGAGFATISRTMHWLILYMIAYPEVQTNVQSEIDKVVGRERKVDVADRSKLHYTQATILEVMRIRNVTPLALPHSTLKNTTINGYDIDKGTVVVINLHSANHDDTVWQNPELFQPERHLDEDNFLRKQSPVAPFGFGRRRCIGEYLAKIQVFILFASLMQRCTFLKPEADSIDLEPVELLARSPKPYQVIVKDRGPNFTAE